MYVVPHSVTFLHLSLYCSDACGIEGECRRDSGGLDEKDKHFHFGIQTMKVERWRSKG